MKRILLFLALLCATAAIAQPSYWFQGWERKPDAAQAQAYFVWPGTNITFSYASNRFIVNGAAINNTSFWAFLKAGTNIYFTTNAGLLEINATGSGTNVNTNCYTFSGLWPVDVTVPGPGCSNVTYFVDTALSDWAYLPTNSAALIWMLNGASNKLSSQITNWVYVSTNTTSEMWGAVTNFINGATNTTSQLWAAVTNSDATVSNNLLAMVWRTNGNTIGASPAFIGTLDNQNFVIKQNNTVAATFSPVGRFAVANSSANANYADAFGNGCTASGAASFAGGSGCTASGNQTFAFGLSCTASGNSSFVAGNASLSQGDGSFTAGINNNAVVEAAVAIGEGNTASGIGSAALGLAATANFDGSFVWSDSNGSGYQDSTLNQFIVGSSGGVIFNTSGAGVATDAIMYATNGLISTNLQLWFPQWIDMPWQIVWSGGSAGPLQENVTNLVKAFAFKWNDEIFAQCQAPHTLAVQDASRFPNVYYEPHVHYTINPTTTIDSTHSNVCFVLEWLQASINGAITCGTNRITNGVTSVQTHYLAEFGHITNNNLGISGIFSARFWVSDCIRNVAPNNAARSVMLLQGDNHYPVGNFRAIGSRLDNTQ